MCRLTAAIRRLTSSLRRHASPFGCEVLVLSGGGVPGPPASLGVPLRESRAVLERSSEPLVDRREELGHFRRTLGAFRGGFRIRHVAGSCFRFGAIDDYT